MEFRGSDTIRDGKVQLHVKWKRKDFGGRYNKPRVMAKLGTGVIHISNFQCEKNSLIRKYLCVL